VSLLDVSVLGALVASDQEGNQLPAGLLEVHAISGTKVNAKFRYPFPDRSSIAGIPGGQALNPNLDTGPTLEIAETVEPTREPISLPNLRHEVV
jgi:hypothetical protein